MLGIIVLAVVLAVGMLALVIMTVISHGIHRYEKHYVERGASDLTEMFYFIDGRQLLLMAGASGLILGLMSYALFNWFVGAAMALIGIFTPHFGIRVLRQRRIRKFERQLVDALNQMSAAFRAGLTLNQAAESVASEMGARMSAMENATNNAGEMISRLTLVYNRARQAAITKELLEVISGAEALKG